MPESHYVSKYSGEEIDALLDGAGTGTVRYDAAQTLTGTQKTQARGNIGAAPDGYGLGSSIVYAPSNSDGVSDANLINATGFYLAIANVGSGGWNYVFHMQYPSDAALQFGSFVNDTTYQIRKKLIGVWQPWEWVNPPMQLGVEYRTTERFLGKPVYVKAINFGAVAVGMNQVAFMSDVERPIRCYAMLTDRNATIPWIGTPGTDQSFCSINGANARIYSTVAFPAGAVVFVGYYYKTNE